MDKEKINNQPIIVTFKKRKSKTSKHTLTVTFITNIIYYK